MSNKAIAIGGIIVFLLGGAAATAVYEPSEPPAPEVQTKVVVKEKTVEVPVEVYGGMTPECLAVVDGFDKVTDHDIAVENATADMLDQYVEMKKATTTDNIGEYSKAQENANAAFDTMGTESLNRQAARIHLDVLMDSCDTSIAYP